MNFKQKLGYTAFGAAIMLIGVLAANHLTPIAAQNNGVFDEITCKKLVVSNNGKWNVVLSGGEKGGLIGVLDKDGNVRIAFSSLSRGASLEFYGPSQSYAEDINNPFIRLQAAKSGGMLTLSHGTDTPLGAFLIDESGKSILMCDRVLD